MSVGHAMKPISEAHFAILRRHMVEVIGIQVELASEELGKAALDTTWALGRCRRSWRTRWKRSA
jgi:hypothetical protein